MNKLINNVKYIQKRIGHTFKNIDLLYQAFVRPSYSDEYSMNNFNTLKFIGTNVLDFYVAKALVNKYSTFLEDNDGQKFQSNYYFKDTSISLLKDKLLSSKILAHRIDLLGIKNYLLINLNSPLEEQKNMYIAKKELFYTILGAITLDSSWNPNQIEKSVKEMLNIEYYLENGFEEEQSKLDLLNKWSEKQTGNVFKFTTEVISDQLFKVSSTVKTKRGKITYSAEGTKKGEAINNLATKVYEDLLFNDDLYTIKDELPNELTLDNAVETLEKLAFKGYISMPEYKEDLNPKYDHKGILQWACECSVLSENLTYKAYDPKKKDAKKYSAYLCICHICKIKDIYK